MTVTIRLCRGKPWDETWILDIHPDGTVTLTRQSTMEQFAMSSIITAVGKAMEISCAPHVAGACLGC